MLKCEKECKYILLNEAEEQKWYNKKIQAKKRLLTLIETNYKDNLPIKGESYEYIVGKYSVGVLRAMHDRFNVIFVVNENTENEPNGIHILRNFARSGRII